MVDEHCGPPVNGLAAFTRLPASTKADQVPHYEVSEYLQAIEHVAGTLLDDATTAGRTRPVPTCPGWDAAELVTHLTMVYSWAHLIITERRQEFPTDSDLGPLPNPATPEDFEAALASLTAAISQAPEDLKTAVFLKHAGPPRWFWARRLTHETTIHRVDALSAKLGRLPVAAEADIPLGLAVDGIDELLRGFVNRKTSKLRTPTPATFVVDPDDADVAWSVRVSAESPVVELGAIGDPDAVLHGSAAALYLGLWNRGDEVGSTGQPGALGMWRDKVRIAWS